MFTDLKKLLKTKMDAQKGDNIVSKKGEKHGNNVNVLQIGWRSDYDKIIAI